MSDARLQQLHKAALQGGVEENARYLAELIRQGHLARARVELAARLGHQAAKLVTGELNLSLDLSLEWEKWHQRRHAIESAQAILGKTFPVLLAVEFAERTIQFIERAYPGDYRARVAIESALRWVNEPSQENALRAHEAAHRAATGYIAHPAAAAAAYSASSHDKAQYAANAAGHAAVTAGHAVENAFGHAAENAFAGRLNMRDQEYAWQRERLISYLLNPRL